MDLVWRCCDLRMVSTMFEVATYVLAVVILHHALFQSNKFTMSDTGRTELLPSDRYNRARWVWTLVWGIFFGCVIEILLVKLNDYRYGDHFLFYVPSPFGRDERVPLSVGVGWGVLLYTCTLVAQRLKQSTWARALFAGLLALSIDASLDPVARIGRLWNGSVGTPNFHGVPYDNFTGWMLIVTSYSFCVRCFFGWIDKSRSEKVKSVAAIWVPFVACAIATGITGLTDHILNHWIYPSQNVPDPRPVLCPEWAVFGGLVLIALLVVGKNCLEGSGNHRPIAAILAVPLVYHPLCWACAQTMRENIDSEQHSLVTMAIPFFFVVTMVAFLWGWKRDEVRARAEHIGRLVRARLAPPPSVPRPG